MIGIATKNMLTRSEKCVRGDWLPKNIPGTASSEAAVFFEQLMVAANYAPDPALCYSSMIFALRALEAKQAKDDGVALPGCVPDPCDSLNSDGSSIVGMATGISRPAAWLGSEEAPGVCGVCGDDPTQPFEYCLSLSELCAAVSGLSSQRQVLTRQRQMAHLLGGPFAVLFVCPRGEAFAR